MRIELRQAAAQKQGAKAVGRGNAHHAGQREIGIANAVLRGDGLCFDVFGGVQQARARFCQRIALWAALKKLSFQRGLQTGDAPRNSGMVGFHTAGGQSQRARPRHTDEKPQIIPVELRHFCSCIYAQ